MTAVRHTSWSPDSHRGGPGSIPVQSMWELCWAKYHWDRFYPSSWLFPCQCYSTVALRTQYHQEDEHWARWWLQFRDIVLPPPT
jgi:hypothetical protein